MSKRQSVLIKLTTFLVVLSVCLNPIALGFKKCEPHSMRDVNCGVNETCSPLGVCECRPGFREVNSTCYNATIVAALAKIAASSSLSHFVTASASASNALPVTHNKHLEEHENQKAGENSGGSGSHVVAGIFIPLTLIMLVIIGVFLNRKYRVVSWIRAKIHQRSSNYDEVMIGQVLDDDDDPPLH